MPSPVTSPDRDSQRPSLKTILICAAIAAAPFAKTVSFPFVNWGDPVRILEPAAQGVFGLASILRAFVDSSRLPYQPVAEIVFGLNTALTGANPAAFHAVNVALHALTAVILCAYLLRWSLDQVPAVVGALFYALHPLRVEVVAWASGRAELLAVFFVVLSGLFFSSYRDAGQIRWYLASLAASVGAVGSSGAAVVWPIVLAAAYRADDRWSAARRMADLTPFGVISLAGLIVPTIQWIDRSTTSGMTWTWLGDAAALPASVLLFSIWQTVAPTNLAVVYMIPSLGFWWWALAAFLAVALVTAWKAARDPVPRMGLVWAMVFLIPSAVGLTEEPGTLSDRSMTLAGLGWSFLVGALLNWLLRQRDGRFARPVKISAVLLLALFGTLSSIHSEVWSSSEALWSAATDRAPASALAHNYLGSAIAQESADLARAEQSFTIAIFHDPTMQAAYVNRAVTRAALGRRDEALSDLHEALRLDPNDAATRMVRAALLRSLGRLDDALRDMHLSLATEPTNIPWMIERVELLQKMGRTGEAAAEIEVLRRLGYEVSFERPADRTTADSAAISASRNKQSPHSLQSSPPRGR